MYVRSKAEGERGERERGERERMKLHGKSPLSHNTHAEKTFV